MSADFLFFFFFISALTLLNLLYILPSFFYLVVAGLAPHNKYPSQLQESLRAYKYLIEDIKVDFSKIIFGTDRK